MADRRSKGRLRMIRKVPLSEAKRDFDREFWQKLGTTAIFRAAWEMVIDAYALTKAQQRLQRTAVGFRPAPGPVPRRRRLGSDALH